MARIDDLVGFLLKKGSLGVSPCPWPTAGADDVVLPLDYKLLLGRRGRRRRARESNLEDVDEFSIDDDLFDERFDDPWESLGWEIDEKDWGEFEEGIGEGYEPDPRSDDAKANEQRDPSQMDIAAWYQPVHFHGYDWGIYIREDAIIRQRNLIARCLPRHCKGWPHHVKVRLYRACYRASFAVYLLHEQYHHKTECLGVRLHVVEGHSSYLPYFGKVYLPLKGTDDHLEEALANAYIFQRIWYSPYSDWLGSSVLQATVEFLRKSIPLQPPGYRKALAYESKQLFDQAENILQAQIREGSEKPTQTPAEWDLAPNMIESFFPWKTTLYTVLPASAPRSRIWPHMQPAPSCSSKELIKLCRNRGWSEVKGGGKGSHVKLAKPGANRPIVIPGNRKRLSPGSLNSSLQSLGIRSVRELPAILAAL